MVVAAVRERETESVTKEEVSGGARAFAEHFSSVVWGLSYDPFTCTCSADSSARKMMDSGKKPGDPKRWGDG